MAAKVNNQFEKINALRSNVSNLVASAYTFNQAVKSLQGLEKKHAEACALLGVESFTVKSILAAWNSALNVEGEDGKKCLALYMPVQVTIEGTDDEGQPIEKNAYERKVNSKGVVSFKALKVRTLMTPEKWTPSIIIEGLCQSVEAGLAKLEAEVSELHAKNVLHDGAYIKVTEKDEEGGSSIHFEKA